MNVWAAAVAALMLQAGPGGQADVDVTAAVAPDSVRIGERFTLRVSVSGVEDGAEVRFPALPDTGVVTALGPPLVLADRSDGGRSAQYELAAWSVGDLKLPRGDIQIVSGGAERRVRLPDVGVRVISVLPEASDADTLEWRPPADVVGPNWSLGEKLAAAAAALALALAAVLYVRRRAASRPVPVLPAPPPRERALEALDLLEQSGLIEVGEFKGFYSALSQVVREFLADSEPAWGLDLTTVEIVAKMEGEVDEPDLAGLSRLLGEADMVKFARRRPSADRARRALEACRAWVADFERKIVEEAPVDEESASMEAQVDEELEPESAPS